jgi:hypothetical protein
MNKKLHFLLFCLLLIVILCSCKDKLLEIFGNLEPFGKLEPFGNQIVIHPDTAELNPRETTFSVLTYDTNLGSGATQLSTCSDDSSWRMGEKTCRDYSLSGSNCEDIGSDGRSAFDACKVACDNCNTYTEVKRRLPSPIEDVDEPSYAQFEGSISDGDTGSDIGSADYREIISRLDDMKDSMGTLDRTVGATSDITQLSLDNMSQELRDSLSGVDSNGDGALTSEEFIQFSTGLISGNQSLVTINLAKGRIIVQGKNTAERLLEVIDLFKRNSEFTGDKVPGLPESPINVANYAALETAVQGLKGVIERFNKDNTQPKVIIINIYKIIVYFARLRLQTDPAVITAIPDGVEYKSKLEDLNTKKLNLLQKLVNDPAGNPNINSDIDGNINAQINNATPPGGGAIFNRDTFLIPDSIANARYMSNILNALGEFRKILVDFQGSLQTDLNRASGVILPGTSGGITQEQYDAGVENARVAGIAAGRAGAEGEEADKDAASAAAAKKAEEDKETTAAEVGAVLAGVGFLGYLAAKAADLLD